MALAVSLAVVTVSGFRGPGALEGQGLIRSTHIRLLVSDFGAEFRFFRDVLGFACTFGKEDDVYADFDCNGVSVALFKRELMSEDLKHPAPPRHAESEDRLALIFGVEDVDATCTELAKKGVHLIGQPHDRKDWGIRVAHFRDPEGNLVEINHGLKP
jgi:lactoylglutathione lyase